MNMLYKTFLRLVRRYLGTGLVVLVLAVVLGCANKLVNFESYERITKDMPMEEVEAILGKPSRRHHHDYYYEGQYGTIKIEAEKGRVDEKKWKERH